jgi:hypothetical protein
MSDQGDPRFDGPATWALVLDLESRCGRLTAERDRARTERDEALAAIREYCRQNRYSHPMYLEQSWVRRLFEIGGQQ